jgi:hypothetical protein
MNVLNEELLWTKLSLEKYKNKLISYQTWAVNSNSQLLQMSCVLSLSAINLMGLLLQKKQTTESQFVKSHSISSFFRDSNKFSQYWTSIRLNINIIIELNQTIRQLKPSTINSCLICSMNSLTSDSLTRGIMALLYWSQTDFMTDSIISSLSLRKCSSLEVSFILKFRNFSISRERVSCLLCWSLDKHCFQFK